MSICLNYAACLQLKKIFLDMFCRRKSNKSVNVELTKPSNDSNVMPHANLITSITPESENILKLTENIDSLYKTVMPQSPHIIAPPSSPTSSDEISWNDTVAFTFPIAGGHVIKVYDGDTITIASKMPYADSPLYRFNVRLNGINAPEIKGKNDDEKIAAKATRDALSHLIMHKYVNLENVQSEKYGRILADVYVNYENDKIHVNQWLINEGYAVKYNGGTKKSPISWLKYKEFGIQ